MNSPPTDNIVFAAPPLIAAEKVVFGGVPVSRLLPEDKFDGAKADLVALEVLARQILSQNVARDESFIETVLRPPVSIRKVRALVRRQTFQPGLI